MEAEPLFRRSLAIREKNRGLHHPEVATGLDNLAFVLRAQVRMEKLETFVVCMGLPFSSSWTFRFTWGLGSDTGI